MKENFLKLSHELTFILVALAGAIAPLFFLPTTSEFFQTNKMIAFLVITITGLVIWSARMVLDKKTTFTRTPLDIPLLILLVVFFIATFASIDQYVSTFGPQGKVWPSFFALVTLCAFYFMAVANLKSRKHVVGIIWVLIISTTIASLIAIDSYFGLFLPFEFAKIRSFNPVGVINKLAVLQAFVIPIVSSWAIFDKHKTTRAVATITTLIIALSFILINFLPAYIGLAASIGFIALGTLRTKLEKNQQGAIGVLIVFISLFFVLRFIPQVAQGTLGAWIVNKDTNLSDSAQIDTPKELTLPIRPAWDMAAQAIGKRPLFGTGPGTYAFVYSQLKPRYMNSTEQWAVRFDKSNSDFTEIIATTGIFGVLAHLLLLVAIVRFIWALVAKSQHALTYLPIAAAIFGYLVASFFTTSSIANIIPLFIALAALSTLAKINDEAYVYEVTVEIAALKNKLAWLPFNPAPNPDPFIKTEVGTKGAKSQIMPLLFTLIVLGASGYALFHQYNAYRAEYFFRQSSLAARSNDGNKTVGFIQSALKSNPRIDTYHRTLSQTSLNAAVNLSRKGNLTENEKQILSQLAQVAIDQAKVASGYQILPLRLPGISAANVANWETLSAAYQALIGSVGGADVHAVNTLAQAVALDPQNPILHNQLGQLYQRLNNLDLAQRKYEDASIVKGDFGPAHYNLSQLLIEKKGSVPSIVNELTLAKKFLPSSDNAIADIDADLETYNKQLKELQEQAAQNQNQEQPQASPSPGASPTPSPSPSPSTSPTGKPSPSPTL